MTGDLLRSHERVALDPYRDRPEVPYTAVEPYSGQHRTCRFLVTHLQGKARGATLVVFRWIGPTLRSLARVDKALAGMVVLGFLGTAVILAVAVRRALRPVEEVTRMAEQADAEDLSRRAKTSSGGEEFRRLAAVINSLFERLERAFRAQRRLVADAAHELKTPTAVLVGEAQDALRPEATARGAPALAPDDRGRLQGPRPRGRRASAARPRRRRAAPTHRGSRPGGPRRGGRRHGGGARRAAARRLRALQERRHAPARASARGFCA